MQFQSTPVITDGRTCGARVRSGTGTGFNPRPSSLTGERQLAWVVAAGDGVSIHARHH